jgi:hypothetical protein
VRSTHTLLREEKGISANTDKSNEARGTYTLSSKEESTK